MLNCEVISCSSDLYISLMISDVEHIFFLFIYNFKIYFILALLSLCCWAFSLAVVHGASSTVVASPVEHRL